MDTLHRIIDQKEIISSIWLSPLMTDIVCGQSCLMSGSRVNFGEIISAPIRSSWWYVFEKVKSPTCDFKSLAFDFRRSLSAKISSFFFRNVSSAAVLVNTSKNRIRFSLYCSTFNGATISSGWSPWK